PMADEMWRWDVSPADFAQLAGAGSDHQAITMHRGNGSVEFETTSASGAIASATLTVSEDGLRPIAQTLVVRAGDGLVEYRFVEAAADRIRVAEVPHARFEPEPALTNASDADANANAIGPRASDALASGAAAIDRVALDRWELTATWRLHRLSPCLATP